jgi:hypothetical protein
MATKTETLTMPVMHVYYLTADPANDTGYTMEQATDLLNEYGPEHQIEITITTPVYEPPVSEDPVYELPVSEESVPVESVPE